MIPSPLKMFPEKYLGKHVRPAYMENREFIKRMVIPMAEIRKTGIRKDGAPFTDTIVESRSRSNFYNLEQLKQIPIADVCQRLGMEMERRHNGTWCKVRKESVASTLIHTDKNTFYDFGTNTGGDTISFVGYVMSLERKDAIRALADMYHIEPVNPRDGMASSELTDWEYQQIGLYGDMATKNFDFDMERMPIERVYEISTAYAMPMNELKKKHPKTYERIIRQRALPYVRELRNNYFLHVWDRYQMAKAVGNPQLFYKGDLKAAFADDLRDLTGAERILERAVKDTSIKLRETKKEYDPAKDLELLSNGEIKPGLSEVSYTEIQAASKETGCPIKYRTMDYADYMNSSLDAHFHSAFFKAGKVVVGYLDKDWKDLQPMIEKKPSLSDKLQAAASIQAERKEGRPVQSQGPER